MKVAIIPARGGSKRIPMKNIKIFHGKPMIAYSIETAMKSGCFDEIIVSTDNFKIQKIAREYGATCDNLRPKSLSNDFIGTTEVIQYEVRRLVASGYDLDVIAEIYPTAPLMQSEFLKEGLDVLSSSSKSRFVFSAVEFEYPVQRGFRIVRDGCEALDSDSFLKRSQDLTPIFHDAAQFYLAHYQTWLDYDFRFDKLSTAVVLPREFVIDIDNESDWKIAEAVAAYHGV